MKSNKLFPAVLAALVVLGLSLPVVAQSGTQSGNNTTTTTTTTQDANAAAPNAQDSTGPDNSAPMTKSEMKAQKKQQKQQEKAANASAKAQKDEAKGEKNDAKADKDRADALKQEHKSTDAAEKANTPQ
jgi:hypothetical protein